MDNKRFVTYALACKNRREVEDLCDRYKPGAGALAELYRRDKDIYYWALDRLYETSGDLARKWARHNGAP